MRVLSISGPLPRPGRVGSLAPVARQIDSIRRQGVVVDVLEIDGPAKLKYAATLPRVLARSRSVELVHAHFGYSGWLGLAQPWRPLVISFMGQDLLGRRDARGHVTVASQAEIHLNRAAARRADAAIVKSEGMAAVIADARPHVVPNGVDMTRFVVMDRIAARRRLGWDPGARIALFPGCPAFANKGHHVATAAVAHAAARLGTAVELKILWEVEPADVPVHMAAADAMVLASEQEGSPNVVKEALACELPIVATPVGDVPRLLADAPGCHVCPRTPEALGDALVQALTLGRLTCGRALLIARGLDEESVARRVIALYHAVLHNREVAR